MPKEIVQYANDSTDTAVAVHWSKESSHVQLSITRYPFHGPLEGHSDDGELADEAVQGGARERERLSAPGAVDPADTPCDCESAGEFSCSEVNHCDSGGPTSRTEYSDVMSRYEINQLIRTLRRARDAAYGADA